MPEQDGTQAAKDWIEKPIVWDLLDDGDAKYPPICRDCAISPNDVPLRLNAGSTSVTSYTKSDTDPT